MKGRNSYYGQLLIITGIAPLLFYNPRANFYSLAHNFQDMALYAAITLAGVDQPDKAVYYYYIFPAWLFRHATLCCNVLDEIVAPFLVCYYYLTHFIGGTSSVSKCGMENRSF